MYVCTYYNLVYRVSLQQPQLPHANSGNNKSLVAGLVDPLFKLSNERFCNQLYVCCRVYFSFNFAAD